MAQSRKKTSRILVAVMITVIMLLSFTPVMVMASEFDLQDDVLSSYYEVDEEAYLTKLEVTESPAEVEPAETEEKEAVSYTDYTVIIHFEADYLFVERSDAFSLLDLLDGVSAADQDGMDVPVFVLDDGNFDIDAEWPDNGFTIVYAAIHPVTEEQFVAERMVFVTESIVALDTISVNSWAALRIAIDSNPNVTVVEIMSNIYIPATAGAGGNAITIPAGRNITLVGGGHIIRRTALNQRHFLVNGTLRLEDVTLSGNYPTLATSHGGVEVRAGGHLIMEDGSVITNNCNTGNTSAAAVFVNGADAAFTMRGGEISYNSTLSFTATSSTGSAAVFVDYGGIFTMYGGVIRNNTGRFGGGVRVGRNLVFNNRMYMHGGEIYGNTAFFGGGVNLERGTFTMTGGTIHNNTATGLNNNPTITDLVANRGGGGVLLQNAGRFYMEGGTIRDNNAHYNGGGVMMLAGTAFTMDGGIISGNTAANNGGGVHVTGALFSMIDGAITDNIAANHGGGIWLGVGTATANARLNMTGGTISNNTATNGDGGGIFTTAHNYSDPLPSNAYLNILAAAGNFSGNTAGGGQFAPPSNADIRPFGHLLTNYNINYRGPTQVFSITFNLNGGNVSGNTSNITYAIPLDIAIGDATAIPVPVRNNHTFGGWQLDGTGVILTSDEVAQIEVTGTKTFVAVWIFNAPEVEDTPPVEENLPESENANSTLRRASRTPGDSPPAIAEMMPQVDGIYHEYGETPRRGRRNLYMVGFEDGTVRPGATATRAEVAAMMLHLMSQEDRAVFWRQDNPYTDVAATGWYNTAISTVSHFGLISGMPDGFFQPNRAITRAEFTTVLVNFRGEIYNEAPLFNDIAGHWAQKHINAAARNGWITGHEGLGGAFLPDQPITRAEAAAIINQAFNRLPGSTNDILTEMRSWPDNADASTWYYLHIQEATNMHYYYL
ncbi:MAG: S-layer homology domain-containing protein [Defluviitaleaceae bacterium]|nr:S-layer homology domain-containing protein [Defluviitaleaceae bacterium]